jgi:hypothetical protein
VTTVAAAPPRDLSARHAYMIVSVVAVGVIFLIELRGELFYSSLLVLMAGLVSIVAPQRISPLLTVVVFVVSHLTNHFFWFGFEVSWQPTGWSLQLADVARSGALLAYVAGHYRLQALTDHILPPDPRHRAGPSRFHWSALQWLPDLVLRRRSAKLISTDEMAQLLLTLPFFAVLAQIVGFFFTRPWNLAELPSRYTRVILFAWLLGIGGLVLAALVNHWRRRSMSPDEALLFLQDTHWVDLRRDQHRAQRACARARLRRQL